MKMQWVLLVVSKHLKHNGLTLDVLNEGLCDLNGNLSNDEQQQEEVVKITYIIKVQLRFVCLFTLTFWTW